MRAILFSLICLVFGLAPLAEAQEPAFHRRHEAVITVLDKTRHFASFIVTPKNTRKFKEPFLLSDYPVDPEHLTVLVKHGRATPHAADLADLHVGAHILLTSSSSLSNGKQVSEIILLRDRQ